MTNWRNLKQLDRNCDATLVIRLNGKHLKYFIADFIAGKDKMMGIFGCKGYDNFVATYPDSEYINLNEIK